MSITAGTGKAEKAVVNPAANGYRLPTDAEWEYAARGGEQHASTAWNYPYAGSDTISNVAVNGTSGTAVIKTKAPNTAGLFDMTGNVAEWCWDETNSNKRVTRVGAFDFTAGYSENDYRNDFSLSSATTSYGFRVARNAN